MFLQHVSLVGISLISTSQVFTLEKSTKFLRLKCSSGSNGSPYVNYSKVSIDHWHWFAMIINPQYLRDYLIGFQLVAEVKARLEKENPELPLGLKGRDDEEMISWFLKDRKYSVDDALTKLRKSIVWLYPIEIQSNDIHSIRELFQSFSIFLLPEMA